MIKQYLKSIILLLSVSTLLNGDFLLYLEQDRDAGSEVYCITDYYYDNNRIYFLQSDDNSYDSKRLRDYSSVKIDAGYMLDEDSNCIVVNINTSNYEATTNLDMATYTNFSFLGIPLAYFNSLMALSGLLISFIFLYGLTRFI